MKGFCKKCRSDLIEVKLEGYHGESETHLKTTSVMCSNTLCNQVVSVNSEPIKSATPSPIEAIEQKLDVVIDLLNDLIQKDKPNA